MCSLGTWVVVVGVWFVWFNQIYSTHYSTFFMSHHLQAENQPNTFSNQEGAGTYSAQLLRNQVSTLDYEEQFWNTFFVDVRRFFFFFFMKVSQVELLRWCMCIEICFTNFSHVFLLCNYFIDSAYFSCGTCSMSFEIVCACFLNLARLKPILIASNLCHVSMYSMPQFMMSLTLFLTALTSGWFSTTGCCML